MAAAISTRISIWVWLWGLLELTIRGAVHATSFPDWRVRLSKPYTNVTCKTDEDCLYLGECIRSSGICNCDPGFKGSHCHELDLLPTDPTWGFNNISMPSWGGSIVKHKGEYHLIASYIAEQCDITSYGTNSAIMRATSKLPQGPYEYKETILRPFHHGAVIIEDKQRRKFYLWADGAHDIPESVVHICKHAGQVTKNMPSKSFPDPRQRTGLWRFGRSPHDFVSVYESDQLANGKWTPRIILSTNLTAGIACNRTNPAPLLMDDGSVLFTVRTTYCDHSGATCRYHPHSPRNCQHLFQVRLENPTAPVREQNWRMLKQLDGSEDPFLWMDRKKRIHMLVHSKNACTAGSDTCGLLAFSKDGTKWTSASRPAYTGYVKWRSSKEQQETVVREKAVLLQRPKIFFDQDSGHPLFLICGFRRHLKDHIQTLLIPFNVPENRHLAILAANGSTTTNNDDGEEQESERQNETDVIVKHDSADDDLPSITEGNQAQDKSAGDIDEGKPFEDDGSSTEEANEGNNNADETDANVTETIDYNSLPVSARKGGHFGYAFIGLMILIALGVHLSIKYWRSTGREYSVLESSYDDGE